jgi:hypothetical protein
VQGGRKLRAIRCAHYFYGDSADGVMRWGWRGLFGWIGNWDIGINVLCLDEVRLLSERLGKRGGRSTVVVRVIIDAALNSTISFFTYHPTNNDKLRMQTCRC